MDGVGGCWYGDGEGVGMELFGDCELCWNEFIDCRGGGVVCGYGLGV